MAGAHDLEHEDQLMSCLERKVPTKLPCFKGLMDSRVARGGRGPWPCCSHETAGCVARLVAIRMPSSCHVFRSPKCEEMVPDQIYFLSRSCATWTSSIHSNLRVDHTLDTDLSGKQPKAPTSLI
jgi:hypothetical protein